MISVLFIISSLLFLPVCIPLFSKLQHTSLSGPLANEDKLHENQIVIMLKNQLDNSSIPVNNLCVDYDCFMAPYMNKLSPLHQILDNSTFPLGGRPLYDFYMCLSPSMHV